MNRECSECLRLWKEYAEATIAHVQASSKLQLAVLIRDSDAIRELTPKIEAAETARAEWRDAVRRHEAAAHPKADAAEAD